MEPRRQFEKTKMNNVHQLDINVCLSACFRYAKSTHCYLHSFDHTCTNSNNDSDLHNLQRFKMATRENREIKPKSGRNGRILNKQTILLPY